MSDERLEVSKPEAAKSARRTPKKRARSATTRTMSIEEERRLMKDLDEIEALVWADPPNDWIV